jgi:division protein CdvB (Snf7/Vps24/ESCRT-III family)
LKLFSFFFNTSESGLKDKISAAVKQIEAHRKELETLRGKLEARRQSLFETTVRALEKKDEIRATVYANEHAELKKVLQVVTANELALTQITVRLESIRDLGDIVYQINSVFKILRKIGRTVSGMAPALESATEEVNATLTNALEGLSAVAPNISLDVKTDSENELVERAKMYAEQKSLQLGEDIPSFILTAKGNTIFENTKKIALLATGDTPNENECLPVMLSTPKSRNIDEEVRNYVAGKNGQFNVLEASSVLNLRPDEVEEAVLKLASEGKIMLGKR